jgi:hypothetical protein
MYFSEFTASKKKMGLYFYSHQIILNKAMLVEITLAPVTYHECHLPPPKQKPVPHKVWKFVSKLTSWNSHALNLKGNCVALVIKSEEIFHP